MDPRSPIEFTGLRMPIPDPTELRANGGYYPADARERLAGAIGQLVDPSTRHEIVFEPEFVAVTEDQQVETSRMAVVWRAAQWAGRGLMRLNTMWQPSEQSRLFDAARTEAVRYRHGP